MQAVLQLFSLRLLLHLRMLLAVAANNRVTHALRVAAIAQFDVEFAALIGRCRIERAFHVSQSDVGRHLAQIGKRCAKCFVLECLRGSRFTAAVSVDCGQAARPLARAKGRGRG